MEIAIITQIHNLGAPGSEMLDNLDIYLEHSPSLTLNEIRQAHSDTLLAAEKLTPEDIDRARYFRRRAEAYYQRHGYDPDALLTVDAYPLGTMGTEITLVEEAREMGSPGPDLGDILQGYISSDTLTLAGLREAQAGMNDALSDTQASDFVRRFETYYSVEDLSPDDPVTLSIW